MRAQDNIYNSSDTRGLLNPSFIEASSRDNIATGDHYTTLFGKIKKYFSDLKSGAFNSIEQGTYITVTTNDTTHETEIKHNNSGVTAASKGDTTNQTPGFGDTFKVTSGTVDAQGHFTAFADHTVKIPTISFATGSANGNISVNINGAGATDIKVKGISDLAYIAKGSDNSKYLRSDGSWVKPPNDNTTYSFTGGTNKFTVTPSGGTAFDVSITPSITNNITGSGTNGYIAKFNGKNTITNGPAFGSDTTKYLRNDGSWVKPPNDNTTYTFAEGSTNGAFSVTPSGGSALSVKVHGLGSLAYKNSLSKSDVGLGNVENKSSATIRGELTKANVTTALGYTPPTSDTNTTYTIATGDSNGQIKVTPSSGSAYNVNVKGLGSAAYTASSDYAGSGHNHDSTYLKLSGGTITGNILMSGSSSIIFSKDTSSTNRPFITYGESSGALNHLDLNGDIVYIGSNVLLLKPGTYTAGIYDYRIVTNNTTLTLNSKNYLNLGAADRVQVRTTHDSGWKPIAASSFDVESSRRYKENITTISDNDALKILDVNIVKYDYKEGVVSDDRDRFNRHGVIAEDVDQIIPEVVHWAKPYSIDMDFDKVEEVPDTVDYSRFVPYLIRMIQIQQEEINELKAKIDNI